MKYVLLLSILALLSVSCDDNSKSEKVSEHPRYEYFYPYDSVPKVYGYRDVANGLDEMFKRVYTVTDTRGRHIIVETFVDRGRLRDAYNFNVDSLQLIDHMIVDASNTKVQTELYKNTLFPWSDETTWFAAKYPGFIDSTFILEEVKRTFDKNVSNHDVLGKKVDCIKFIDSLRWTMVQPYTMKENELNQVQTSYFAKGIGLVEFHGPEKKAHYKLEKIYSEDEWMKIIKH